MTYKHELDARSIRDKRLSAADKLTLGLLARRAREDGTAWPSAVSVAEELRLSVRQVYRCLDRLVDFGYITEAGRTGRSNRVRIWLLTLSQPDILTASQPASQPDILSLPTRQNVRLHRKLTRNLTTTPPPPHEEQPAMTAQAHGGQMDQLPLDGLVPAPQPKAAPPTIQDFANWAYAQGFEDIRPMVARFLLSAAPPSEADEFEEWWSLYPRKQGKGQARTAYAKARRTTSAHTLLASLRDQIPEYQRRGPKYTPMPTTWLNGEQWTNEFTPEPTYNDPYAHMPNITAIRLGWTNGQRP